MRRKIKGCIGTACHSPSKGVLVQTNKTCSLNSMLVQLIILTLLQQQDLYFEISTVPTTLLTAPSSLPLHQLCPSAISFISAAPISMLLHHLCRSVIYAALSSLPVCHLCCSIIYATPSSMQLQHLCRSIISAAWSSMLLGHLCCSVIYAALSLMPLRH